jgi:hypothetical protein
VKTLLATCVALLTLVGCGGSGAAAPTDGCTETPTEELFVQKMYDCGSDVRVYTFADNSARDNYKQAATGFGAVVLGEGDRWLKTK